MLLLKGEIAKNKCEENTRKLTLKNLKVGTDVIPAILAAASLSSMSILAKDTEGVSSLSSTKNGPIRRQGGHHFAVK